MGEHPQVGLLLLLLPGRTEVVAIGEQQAQGEEERGGEQHLLVGVAHEVPTLLVHVDEGGDAQESPHGEGASQSSDVSWRSENGFSRNIRITETEKHRGFSATTGTAVTRSSARHRGAHRVLEAQAPPAQPAVSIRPGAQRSTAAPAVPRDAHAMLTKPLPARLGGFPSPPPPRAAPQRRARPSPRLRGRLRSGRCRRGLRAPQLRWGSRPAEPDRAGIAPHGKARRGDRRWGGVAMLMSACLRLLVGTARPVPQPRPTNRRCYAEMALWPGAQSERGKGGACARRDPRAMWRRWAGREIEVAVVTDERGRPESRVPRRCLAELRMRAGGTWDPEWWSAGKHCKGRWRS